MATTSKDRATAETRFAKAQKQAREGEKARSEYAAKAAQDADKTAKLKALRLAKEAEERSAAAVKAKLKPKSAKKTVPVKKMAKGVGSS
jgi:hypothetical protein